MTESDVPLQSHPTLLDRASGLWHFRQPMLQSSSSLLSQMVCIVQAQATAGFLELLRRQTLQAGLSTDGHENGQLDRAMGQL